MEQIDHLNTGLAPLMTQSASLIRYNGKLWYNMGSAVAKTLRKRGQDNHPSRPWPLRMDFKSTRWNWYEEALTNRCMWVWVRGCPRELYQLPSCAYIVHTRNRRNSLYWHHGRLTRCNINHDRKSSASTIAPPCAVSHLCDREDKNGGTLMPETQALSE